MKKLTKSKNDNLVCGVLGGLASYLNVDSSILRILFVLLVLFVPHNIFGILYLIGCILIPEEE